MECGSCTLCCRLLNIKDVNSPAGSSCKHCKEGVGCGIYNIRPEPCREFKCAWLQMKTATPELRPDKCYVVFEKWSDSVIVGATEIGTSTLISKQIDSFRSESISVVLLDRNTKSKTYYLAPDHTRKFIKQEINDSPKLHRRFG